MTRRIPPVRRLLMDAKALISRPENWLKFRYAETAKGKKIDPFSDRAYRFCPAGAIQSAGNESTSATRTGAIDLLEGLLEHRTEKRTISGFNDAPETTHPMIMRLFNRAIRLAKEQGI